MKFKSLVLDASSESKALEICKAELSGTTPSLIVTFFTEQAGREHFWGQLKALVPSTPIIGSSTCQGLITDQGTCFDQNSIGLLIFEDPEGLYGIGLGKITAEGGEPAGASAAALAIENASHGEESPVLLWVTMPPGDEENVLKGIRSVVGPNVPIMGGSSADNNINGQWQQLFNGQLYKDAIVCSALYPSCEVGIALSSGYRPSSNRAIATKAKGRTLFELDHQPAAQVYNRWLKGALKDELAKGGDILMKTTQSPLGRKVYELEGFKGYILSHPASITEEGAIQLFAEIPEGDEVICMTGSIDSLTEGARIVSEIAREQITGPVSGALLVYCAGCMLTVGTEIERVAEGVKNTLKAPWLGGFTFGEQGFCADNENRHGNLLITAIVFGQS